MHKNLKRVLFALLFLFAGIGLLFSGVFVAMQFDLLNVRGNTADRNAFFLGDGVKEAEAIPAQPCVSSALSECAWQETPEWVVVAGGLTKDAALIERVAQETGIDARLIAASVIPEQIRFFTAEREVFKRYFEPLKILGSLSQFSLGVSGIKQDTAKAVETYANDPASPFYPGPEAATLLAYPAGTADTDAALYARLTNEDDHYYSYLYTALYLKEVFAQWERAGFPIEDDPYAAVTLFNIGFANSRPNDNPQPGGATIMVGGRNYTFGALGGAFYESEELRAMLP